MGYTREDVSSVPTIAGVGTEGFSLEETQLHLQWVVLASEWRETERG